MLIVKYNSMDSLISTFHIDFKILIAQLFNFGVVFIVLYLFALKPLTKIMTERTKKIEAGIKDAREAAIMMQEAEKEYKALLSQARAEGQELLTKAKNEAESRRQAMVAEAKDEVMKVVTQGKNQLASEKLRMVEEARAEVSQLVTKLLSLIVGKGLTEKLDKDFI